MLIKASLSSHCFFFEGKKGKMTSSGDIGLEIAYKCVKQAFASHIRVTDKALFCYTVHKYKVIF